MSKDLTASPDGAIRGDQADPLEALLALAKKGEDIIQFQSPYGPGFLVNHPDYLRHVLRDTNYVRCFPLPVWGQGLVQSEGEYWRNQRRIMQPAFHRHSVEEFVPLITHEITSMLQRWQSFASSAEPMDVMAEMNRLTLAVIGRAMFSVDLSTEVDAISVAFGTINKEFGALWRTVFSLPAVIDPLRNQQVQNAECTFDRIAYELIDAHNVGEGKCRDLLSLLVKEGDEETGPDLDSRQVRDEVVNILTAGYVTTANLLCWTLYSLSQHPGVESRLHKELDTILGGRVPTVADFPNLPYTHTVLQETLRHYPPVWAVSRTALMEDKIGGYKIPPNALVIASIYTCHRHPAFWEDPERFDPDRFTPGRSAKGPSYAYLPFITGQHRCIGEHFAITEALLAVSMVAQRYRLSLAPGFSVEPEPLINLTPRNGLEMTLVKRDI